MSAMSASIRAPTGHVRPLPILGNGHADMGNGQRRREHMPGTPFDPLALSRHRIHVHASANGYEARCVCGWSTRRPSRERRQADIDARSLSVHPSGVMPG
jgi:hypothetical protein